MNHHQNPSDYLNEVSSFTKSEHMECLDCISKIKGHIMNQFDKEKENKTLWLKERLKRLDAMKRVHERLLHRTLGNADARVRLTV